jgi:hypothetical protein
MKRYAIIVALVAVLCGNSGSAQTFNMKFVVMLNNGTNYDVKVQMRGSSLFKLGSSNLVFSYNTAALSSPSLLTAHKFSGGSYSTMTVTSGSGKASVNIALNNPNTGDTVRASYTDVATVRFTTTNPNGNSNLLWDAANTIVFLDDESTLLNADSLNNTNTFPLPIQLATFGAAYGSGRQVVLQWTTVTETNNYGFEIQKSLDANKDYQTVPGSFVKGAGTTIQPRSYSYTVANTDGKSWYYRLKQMDLDGSVSYSEGVLAGASVKAIPTTMALDQNYPNPFNPTTTIDFALPKDQMVTLEVFNILGQRVALLADGFKEAGYYSVPFDARALSSGLYFYRLVTKEQTFLKKMMVVK